MKICNKCGVDKELSEFNNRPKSKDGKTNKCKACNKVDCKKYWNDNYERLRAIQKSPEGKAKSRAYHKTEKRRAVARKYAISDDGKKAVNKASKKYYHGNLKKRAAHNLVSRTLRKGLLEKLPCEVCGKNDGLNAHHDDYDKALEVRWLCTTHHKQWHDLNGEGLNPN